MDYSLILIVSVLATFANGQFDRPFETGIGYIDGRQVTVDDIAEQRFRRRLSQRIPDMGRLGTGGLGQMLVSGTGGDLFGPFRQDRLQHCRATVCTSQFIPARCRYTPVLQTAFGNYCLGCPEDICETQRRRRPRQRRRRRRLRRRLCRNFGICLDRGEGNPLGRRSGNLLGLAFP